MPTPSANNRLYVRAPPPAANRRTWTNRVLVSLQKNNPTYQKVYGIIWRRRRDSKKAVPFSFASQITDCMCPCFSACGEPSHMDEPSSSLSTKNNPTHQKVYEIIWRRRRDSNSRTGFPAYALSRGASSPT